MSDDPQEEIYYLHPVSALKRGDVVYMMADRRYLPRDPWHGDDIGPEFVRVPLRKLDESDDMAPPFQLDMLVPVRGVPHASRRIEPIYASRQDDELIELDINALLTRLRRLVGTRELVDWRLVRHLDSWMTRGFPPPDDWRHGNYNHMIRVVAGLRMTLNSLGGQVDLVERDLRERNRADAQAPDAPPQ